MEGPVGMQANGSKEEKELQLIVTACLFVLILGTGTELDAHK